MNIKNRKTAVVLSLVSLLIVAVVVGGIIYARYNANAATDVGYHSLKTKQALALPRNETCLANNVSVKANVENQNGLGEESGLWTSKIDDIPAGTIVNLNISSYDNGNTITGSLIYPKKYGSYNFTVTKQTDGWRYTKFVGCK